MNERLDDLVRRIQGEEPAECSRLMGGLSTGERCYIALAAGRYDQLPAAYEDPVEAWHRLGPDWQRAVCRWRGWPEDWARAAALAEELRRVSAALDAGGVPHDGCVRLHRPVGRVSWLVDTHEEVRAALRDLYDEQNGPPLQRDRQGWQQAMERARAVLENEHDC